MKEESKIQMSLTNKYHKHIAFSYDYKLLCVDDKLVSRLNHT